MKKKIVLSIALLSTIGNLYASGINNVGYSFTNDEKEELQYKFNKANIEDQDSVLNKKIKVSYYNCPVYYIVKDISERYQIIFGDKNTVVPSFDKYKVTISFEGTLRDFLKKLYLISGVKYEYKNGAIVLVNKDVVEKELSMDKDKENRFFSLHLREGTSLNKAIRYLENVFNIRIVRDFIYKNPDTFKIHYFRYKGYSPAEALELFALNNNLKFEKNGKNYILSDYEEKIFEFPSYFEKVRYSNNKNRKIELVEAKNQKEYIRNLVAPFMSSKGLLSISSKGYIVIRDKPNIVRKVKNIIEKELYSSQPLDVEIYVVGLSSKNSYHQKKKIDRFFKKDENKDIVDFVNDYTAEKLKKDSGTKIYREKVLLKKYKLRIHSGDVAYLEDTFMTPVVSNNKKVVDIEKKLDIEIKPVIDKMDQGVDLSLDIDYIDNNGRKISMNFSSEIPMDKPFLIASFEDGEEKNVVKDNFQHNRYFFDNKIKVVEKERYKEKYDKILVVGIVKPQNDFTEDVKVEE